MEGRRYSDGLHQAIEAKEGVNIAAENQTLATITLQNYFRMYKKLSGMTGTAETEATEFMHTYGLEVIVIPTNLPVIRRDNADLVYKTKNGKIKSILPRSKKWFVIMLIPGAFVLTTYSVYAAYPVFDAQNVAKTIKVIENTAKTD